MAFYLLLSALIFHSEYFHSSLYSHVFSGLRVRLCFFQCLCPNPAALLSTSSHFNTSAGSSWLSLGTLGGARCLQELGTDCAAALPDTLQQLVCRAGRSEAAPQPQQGKYPQHFLQAPQHCCPALTWHKKTFKIDFYIFKDENIFSS